MFGLEKCNESQVLIPTHEQCSEDSASEALKYFFQIFGVEKCNDNKEPCKNNANRRYTSDGLDYPSCIYPINLWIARFTASIGGLGLIANIAAIIILLNIKTGRTLFNRTLAILAVIGGRQVKFRVLNCQTTLRHLI